MINPFQDTPEDLCLRVLAVLDRLDDEELQYLWGATIDAALVSMLELRADLNRAGIPPGQLPGGWISPATVNSWGPVTIIPSGGSFGPYQIAPSATPPVIYTEPKQTSDPPRTSGKLWWKPRGSKR